MTDCHHLATARPSELYKDGLNREHFLPFIALIERELDVLALNGPVDYRLERLGGMRHLAHPAGRCGDRASPRGVLSADRLSARRRAHVPAAELDLGGGRTLHVPKSLKGVAVFSFKRLCAEARGAADYLAIAQTYHTVILVGIPRMGPENRNEAARFVTLIDALYEHKVKLLATAETPNPRRSIQRGDGRI